MPVDLPGIFAHIYDSAAWGFGSGNGSDPVRMRGYLEFLSTFMQLNEVTSVLDVGCGDWRLSAGLSWGDIRYRGIDVVQKLILENRERYGTETIAFDCADVRQLETPRYDLVILKDVLQHLSFVTIQQVLNHLRHCKFVLITNGYPCDGVNRDCIDGGYRGLRMDAPPFSLDGAHVYGMPFHDSDPFEGGKRVFLLRNRSV